MINQVMLFQNVILKRMIIKSNGDLEIKSTQHKKTFHKSKVKKVK